MSPPAGISLCIKARINETYSLAFERNGKTVFEAKSGLSIIQLADLRSQVREALDKFRKQMAEVPQPRLEVVLASLAALHEQGRDILRILFSQNLEALGTASDICRNACPNWDQPGWDPDALAPRLIEVQSSWHDGITIEMLPFLDPIKPRYLDTQLSDVARLAGSFLGFSAIVQRGPRNKVTGRRLENLPQLPVRVFCHNGLPGTTRTRDYFVGEKAFELDHIWPTSEGGGNSAAELAKLLWKHYERNGGSRRERAIQIHHFSCHCDTKGSSPRNYSLRFRGGGFLSKEQRVELGSLQIKLGDLRSDQLEDKEIRPLVFLNACGSADFDPAGIGSFPEMFCAQGFLGFIGTEAVIPDTFASLFAKNFYQHLLDGKTLGQALHYARWGMLKDYKNPLGLLYSLHADADIQVRHRVQKEAVRRTTIAA